MCDNTGKVARGQVGKNLKFQADKFMFEEPRVNREQLKFIEWGGGE